MKILVKGAMVASLMALAACSGGGDDQAAENIESATDNEVEALENMADNTSNGAAADALDDRADAVEEAGEEKADAVDDSDGASNGVESNVSGM